MAGKSSASVEKSVGRPGNLLSGSSGFVELFSVNVNEGLTHSLQVFVALLQQAGRGVGSVIVSPVPVGQQGLERKLPVLVDAEDHPVQAGDLIIRKMAKDPAIE
jgi:hypothetical protein